METHRFRYSAHSRHLRIRPFGDLQKGDKGFREDLWQRWKRDALEDKTSLIIGTGDYSNSFRPTISKRLSKVMVDDLAAQGELDHMITREMSDLADELKPFKNRIIGLLEGHHHHKLISGVTSTQILCQILGVKYLGFLSLIQLIVKFCGGSTIIISIFATHGCGGASLVHSDLQNLERKIMPFWDCDIFLRGHSTKVYVVHGHPLNYIPKRNPNGKDILTIHKRNRLLVNTGGFMEGYTQGNSSYVEYANIPPCALGWTVINLYMPSSRKAENRNFEISGIAVVP